MKAATRLILAAALLVAAQGISADDASQALLSPEIESVVRSGKIHPNWDSALRSTSLDRSYPIQFSPISYSDGVALYRLESLETGAVDHALIEVPTDPTQAPPAEAEQDQGSRPGSATKVGSCVPSSPRCDVPFSTVLGHNKRCTLKLYRDANFGDLLVTTDHDWNTFTAWGGNPLNDRISAIKTTCHGALFFEHQNFGGIMLALGANANLAAVPSNMNDRISSFLHSIP